jgi:hypothetical protein
MNGVDDTNGHSSRGLTRPQSSKKMYFDFADAPVTHEETVGNPTELIRLELPYLLLDVLGLQITLDLFILVEADPAGGPLGRPLDALLG